MRKSVIYAVFLPSSWGIYVDASIDYMYILNFCTNVRKLV